MKQRPKRTDRELRELGGHVLWHAQQLCFLAIHLEERQGGYHIKRFDYELDAAALEAFLIHARALADFLWCEAAHEEDGIASDYFDDAGTWHPTKRPKWYARIRNVIGYGVLHASYKRLKLDERWMWEHRHITHEIVNRLIDFASEAPSDRLDTDWSERLRKLTDPVRGVLPRDSNPVGTPMIAFYRNPSPPV